MSKEHCKNRVIDQGKYIKRAIKRKWTDREYHFQDNYYVAHKDVKIYYDTNQFPALPFCGPHPNPHGSRGLIKHYHLRFDPNMGHGIFEIHCIPCDYVACKLMIDQPWIYGILKKKSILIATHFSMMDT